ncbi:chromosomal replication initiator protein DnaA [Candidatus Kuenenbacteria bacterium HGW-Kuenenbacteria-1]|uniref:Chromosomal replication initiator protein DnaA n=1 Tax=Candidatus Kuenenbacteria bacterium HGW-Kuenenbacteria-1 TaxID=2013812 RepID=A0A2N1UNP1_9BACT|nr:MAG: chromosomal replication initiator protein DnaA [Candidatus Kuenenbacteria bacterium HGW-Kuenenbacteria-1]
MDKKQLWEAVLGELELIISKANFSTWFEDTFISSWQGDEVTIGTPNAFTLAWVERKYHKAIIQALENITDHKIRKIIYKVESIEKSKPQEDAFFQINEKMPTQTSVREDQEQKELKEQEIKKQFNLNSKYSFKNFVVGTGNELAVAAASSIVRQLGIKYNPLFIYGGVGLGKTHLMQAIGNEILLEYPEKKVLYVNSENFANDFIKSIKINRTEEFKKKYRDVDILLMDDIQFIANKERTQEEFFHTFNSLHGQNKQLVFTSDKPPKNIPALEERLISRFSMGMIADVSRPDLETRIAILQAKVKERQFNLDKEIIQYLATNIQTNIRELEGALNKIVAQYELDRQPVTLESTKNVLSTLSSRSSDKAVNSRELIKIVADFYNIKIESLTGSCRKKELVNPRQIAMYLLREELEMSFPAIGQEFGGRDHTTAMHACHKIKKVLENNNRVKQEIELLKQKLYL